MHQGDENTAQTPGTSGPVQASRRASMRATTRSSLAGPGSPRDHPFPSSFPTGGFRRNAPPLPGHSEPVDFQVIEFLTAKIVLAALH